MNNDKVLLQLQLGQVYAEVVRKPGKKGPLSVQSTFYRLFGNPEQPKRARSFNRAELEDLEACLAEVRRWFEAHDGADDVTDGEAACDVVAIAEEIDHSEAA